MTQAEIGLKPSGSMNGWENMYPPDNSEREKAHESAIARIGRIIASKAAEIFQNIKARREAAAEARRAYLEQEAEQREAEEQFYDMQYLELYESSSRLREKMLKQIPEERRERVKFVDRYVDIFQYCASEGQRMSQTEAYQLYEDYSNHIEQMSEDERPHTRVGVLGEMGHMLHDQIEEAQQDGDEATVRMYQSRFNMVQDLEAAAEIPSYYEQIQNMNIFGSKMLLRRYIRDKIEQEGSRGTKRMRESEPPYVGGALSVEATLGVLESIDSDAPMSEIWANLNLNDYEGNIDWSAIEQFGSRGKELHDYYMNLSAAAEKKNQRNEYDENTRKFKESADLLRSDTPIEELPEYLQEAIEDEKISQIAEKLRATLEADRKKIADLRGEGELDSQLQSELSEKGLTRGGYATFLEERLKKREERYNRIVNHDASEGQRAIIDSYQISREDLAARYDRYAQLYSESAAACRQDFRQFREMFNRTKGDFADRILLDGEEGIPECSQDVIDYLYTNYHYDGSANGIGFGESPSLCVVRLKHIMGEVEKRSKWLSRTARYTEKNFGSLIDVEDDIRNLPGITEDVSDSFILFGTGEWIPSQPYEDGAKFLDEEVIPSLQAIIDAINSKIKQATETDDNVIETGLGQSDEQLPAA